MFLITISIIIPICCIAVIGYYLFKAYEKYKVCTRIKMSFAESLRLCELPVVCFNCGDKAFNLLIDSGANNNLVDVNILEQFDFEQTDYTSNMKGVEGNSITIPFVKMKFDYKDEEYEDIFQAVDMSALFGGLKKERVLSSMVYSEIISFKHTNTY